MDQQQQPPLLRALQELDDCTWSRLLLPRLRADGSAASVALSCTQLRSLLQRSQSSLCLSAATYTGPLVPERFPSCSTVKIVIASSSDAVELVPAMLPPLSQLPALTHLVLDARTAEAGAAGYIAPALQMVRLLLPALSGLELHAPACALAALLWRAVAGMSQLAKLVVHVGKATPGGQGMQLSQLSALSSLSQLQALRLVSAGSVASQPSDMSFLSALHGLTLLQMPVVGADGLAAVSGLTRLRNLNVTVVNAAGADAAPRIDERLCAALQQCAALTTLRMLGLNGMGEPAFCGVLRALTQLRMLEVAEVSHASLAVVAGLTSLSYLNTGIAPAEAADGPFAVCPSVRVLSLKPLRHPAPSPDSPLFPWRSFPGVLHICQRRTWSPADLTAITAHCTRLTALVSSINLTRRSVCACPRAQCVAAIGGLAQLVHLRVLQFTPVHEHELAALAQLSQLHKLQIFAPSGIKFTLAGLLVQLAAARHLRELELHLQLLPLQWLQQAGADCLLCGLRHVPNLTMRVTGQQEEVLQAALAAALSMGLDVPAVRFERPSSA